MNMYDIVLTLVKFGQCLIIVFPILKLYHLVQNGRISGKNNFKSVKFASFDPVMTLLKLKIIYHDFN